MNKTKIERIRERFEMGIPIGINEISDVEMMNIIDNTFWGAMIKINVEKEILWKTVADLVSKRSPSWLLKVFDIKY